MTSAFKIIQRVVFWFSDSPRVQLPSGAQIPDGWLRDCLPGGDVPEHLAGQVASSSRTPLTPDLRQCQPWRGVAVGTPATNQHLPVHYPNVASDPNPAPTPFPYPAHARVASVSGRRSVFTRIRPTKTGA
jgi:hypothetical protein